MNDMGGSARTWRWYGALIGVLVAVVAVTFALAMVLLRPPGADWSALLMVLSAPAVTAAALTPLLRRWVSVRASIAGTVIAIGFSSLALGVVASSAAARAMFVSGHDYRMFVVVLVLSCGIAVVVGYALTTPLTDDLRRLGQVVREVASGDLAVKTGNRSSRRGRSCGPCSRRHDLPIGRGRSRTSVVGASQDAAADQRGA